MEQDRELLVKLEKMVGHKCDSCPKVFHNHKDLIKHMAYHEEWFSYHMVSAYVPVERLNLFICKRCNESFYSRSDLIEHQLKHALDDLDTGEAKLTDTSKKNFKPYKCTDCDFEFVSKTSLDEHSIIHLPFPHVCHCGIGYYEQKDLELHMDLAHHSMNTTPKPRTNGSNPQKANTVSKQNNKVSSLQKLEKGKTLEADLITKGTSARKPKTVNLKHKDKCKPKSPCKVPTPKIEIKRTPDDRFQCPKCKKTFGQRNNVNIHYRVHTGERPYSCDQCGSTFTQASALARHIWTHNTTEKYACRYCSKNFFCPYNRARHELIHGPDKPYECPFCNKGFHDPSALTRHKRIHTEDMKYPCPYCPKAFTDVSALVVHKLRHENKKKFMCELCKKKFYVRSHLRVHMSSHVLERNFCCDYCKQYYVSKSNLATHIRRVHVITDEVKSYQCGHCYKKYISKKKMREHILLLHNTEQLYFCKACKKCYSNNFDLRIHQLVHTKQQFECDYCSKKFFLKGSLLFHLRSDHTGIRCEKCLRYFTCQKYLDEHSLVESEQCEICDEEFFCKNLKNVHLKEHFPKKKKKINKHRYECDHCKICYATKSAIFHHITGTHMEKLSCNVCFKSFYYESDFKKHKEWVDCNVIKYTCDHCERSYRTKYLLKRHHIRSTVCCKN